MSVQDSRNLDLSLKVYGPISQMEFFIQTMHHRQRNLGQISVKSVK